MKEKLEAILFRARGDMAAITREFNILRQHEARAQGTISALETALDLLKEEVKKG